jgi:NAD(P)H-quinone oxidoreductase subunit 5
MNIFDGNGYTGSQKSIRPIDVSSTAAAAPKRHRMAGAAPPTAPLTTPRSPMSSPSSPVLPAVLTRTTWLLVAASAAALFGPVDVAGAGFAIDGLTRVMAVVVTLVSALVHSFARRYMAGDRHLRRFFVRLFGLTLIVLLLVAADHVALFLLFWLGMGWMLSALIGHVDGWPAADGARRLARRTFLVGTAALAGGLTILGAASGTASISGIVEAAPSLSTAALIPATLLLLTAAMVQSALVPFQTWLLSSMTAPTPVSAFMHAGIVNAGGVLLARFAGVFLEISGVMLVVFAVGAVSALLGQAWMLVQTDVKRSLGCSTVAQMGFMVLQAGLGFFAAALTHLILHGFYKAYFFLASGSVVAPSRPKPASSGTGSVLSSLLSLAAAVAGGSLFAALTGKSLTALNSGTVLTVFVVLAVLHATQSVVGRTALSAGARALAVPALLLPALAVYAGAYNAVSVALGSVPSAVPAALSPVHGAALALFAVGYVAVERGWHRSVPRLYVLLVNSSQPAAATVRTRREQYPA